MYSDFREVGKSGTGLALGWQIAFGVCIGSLAASFITWGAVEARLRWELQQVAAAQRDQADRASSARIREREAAAAADRERAQTLVAAERARIQATAAAQRAQQAGNAAAFVEVERREQAWRKFYRPSPGCSGAGVSVECSNEFIRFKREFETRYVAGPL